jgi:hypothetical protein
MSHDNPDTIPQAEQTRWLETHADDVFLPSVRVQLAWRDVEVAVERGAIVPQQAHSLWASWAMPGSNTRLAPSAIQPELGYESTLADEEQWHVPDHGASARRQTLMLGVLGGLVVGVVATYLMLR